MGRSKFPGKPSKHVHKKRVNVLACNGLPDKLASSTTSAPQHNTQQLDHNEQVNSTAACKQEGPFARVGPAAPIPIASIDVRLSFQVALPTSEETQSVDAAPQDHSSTQTQNKCSPLKLRSARRTDTVCPLDLKSSDSLLVVKTNSAEQCSESSEPPVCPQHPVNSVNNRVKLETNKSNLRIVKCRLKTNQYDIKSEKSKRKAGYSMSPRKRQPNKMACSKLQQNTSSSFRQHNSESASLVGKFVLPTRSLHSSRVIKPNKKFINNDEKTKTEACVKKMPPRTPETETVNNSVATAPPTLENKDSSDLVVIDSVSNASSWSCGKLVLRKARLQLHTQTSEGGEGPFSNYSSSPANPPGTVTCGVCGAVRFYRFVKQARKFNIYSCESCRKFISKMIKRQACSKNCSVPALVCHKGQGQSFVFFFVDFSEEILLTHVRRFSRVSR